MDNFDKTPTQYWRKSDEKGSYFIHVCNFTGPILLQHQLIVNVSKGQFFNLFYIMYVVILIKLEENYRIRYFSVLY